MLLRTPDMPCSVGSFSKAVIMVDRWLRPRRPWLQSRGLAPVETVRPPTTTSGSQLEPIQLAVLGPGFWWMVDHDGPDQLVEADTATGQVLRIVWAETLDDGPASGATVACRDGSSLPHEVNEVCGQPRFPVVRVTALQLSALLTEAGFTDIAGDHAIDPVWEAVASWDGREYWPLNLFQGDFRPPARP